MIDLSHLTEEEQGMIMKVLKRDAELKKAEEERIGKLQKVLNNGSRSENKLKYLTGEWFYEAKSQRHMDKIHGSEIILASMKQRNLDGSLRLERPRASSKRGSDIITSPKPARPLETTQPQEKSVSDAEKQKLTSSVCSPGRPRHNPFNRASLILIEPPESTEGPTANGDQTFLKSSQTEPMSPLKDYVASQASQTSGGSATSEGTSLGFRPVPKKRTFLSRRVNTLSDSDSSGLGSQAGSKVIVPAPRVSLQRGSCGGSSQSSLRGTGEQSQTHTVAMSNQVSPTGQPLNYPNEVFHQPLCDKSQVSSNIEPERERALPSITKERSVENSSDRNPSLKASSPLYKTDFNFRTATYTKKDDSHERVIPEKRGERDDLTQKDYTGVHTASLLTQSIVDQPVRYDLNFTDKPDQHTAKKSNPKLSKLSHQTPNPTADEEDSIAKVLEWFSRSTDSNDWLDTDDSQQPIINIDREGDFRIGTSITKDAEDIYENRTSDNNKEAAEMKRDRLQREANKVKDELEKTELRATDRMENKEVVEMQEEVRKGTAAQVRPQEKDNEDETKPPKISHLKSFWEKGNSGPRILISRSNTTSDKGQAPVHLSVEKREEEANDNKPHRFDMPSAPAKGQYNKYASNPKDQRETEQPPPVCHHGDTGFIESAELNITSKQQAHHTENKDPSHALTPEVHTSPTYLGKPQSSLTQKKEDPKYNTDYLTLPANSQGVDGKGSDTEIISLTRLSPQPKTLLQSTLGPEPERFSPLRLSPQPESLSQSRGSPLPVKSPSSMTTLQQEQLTRACPSPQLDTSLQARDSPDYEMLSQARHSPYMDYQRGGNDMQFTPKTQLQKGSSEDDKRKVNEDRCVQSSMSPKKHEDSTNKDKTNSPHSQRQAPQRQESTAEKIKQLKSFWEQERNKPMFYTGKSKGLGDSKAVRGSNLVKLNKRFTKSEYDLRSIGNNSGSDGEDSENRQNFTILSMNQRQDKSSPSLGANRSQFNNLREFWGEATSNRRGSFSFDKPKSPKKKEQIDAQPPALELKDCIDTEFYHKSTPVHTEKSNTRPAVVKSSPPSQNRSKSPHDRQVGSGIGNGQQRDCRKGSKDSTREEKPCKSQSNVGKETRSPKTKKDSFGNLSGRGSSLRRATSMFALNFTEEQTQPFVGQLKKTQELSPSQSQGRRQSSDRTQNRRQNSDRGVNCRRSSEDSDTLTPRARAFVPRDYRHYLGMTEKTSVHTSLAPALKEPGSEDKPGHDLDLSGPVRASTPVGSEERYGRKGSKSAQRPLWVNYSSSDTGRDSSMSSTSETWSNSRNSSNRDNDDDNQNPVRRALRRAEVRPKHLAKSLEDITASLTPRQERRQDPIADLRRSSDVPSIPTPSSSLFSDPEHLKKMSKSVPSFLQKEGNGKDTDSTSEDSYGGGRQKTGRSLTNFTNSSGMASVSSLSGSVMTMYSGDFGNVEVQGNIQFSINYVQKLREFHIFVALCQDLAAVDPKRGRSDPYVKSYLVPDKSNLGKRKTSVKKKTLNPTFNEILRYRVRMEYLKTQTLILSVWHHDTFGKNSFLGEVDVDLSKWDFDHTQMNYLALKARTTPSAVPSDDRGEMRLAIRFLPQIIHSEGMAKESPNTGEVHIWVKECKNLPLIRATIDPYVKCFVLPDTSRKSRQKTRVLRRTVDPVFNHTMVYDGIRQEDLTEACIELTVWDRDRLASNLLGGLRLGPGTGRSYGAVVDWMDSTPYEVALWDRMMSSPNEWVEEVLPLRMLTSAKTALK